MLQKPMEILTFRCISVGGGPKVTVYSLALSSRPRSEKPFYLRGFSLIGRSEWRGPGGGLLPRPVGLEEAWGMGG